MLTRPQGVPTPIAADWAKALAFADVLRGEMAAQPPARKSERTRRRLMIATAEALAEHGFSPPRVVDITDRARTSTAAYYVYFRDLRDGVGQLMACFAAWLFQESQRPAPAASDLREIERRVGRLVARANANLGLLQALDRSMEEQSQLAARVREDRRSWVRALVGGPQPAWPRASRFADPLELVDDLLAGLLREVALSGAPLDDVPGLAAAAGRILEVSAPPRRLVRRDMHPA